MLNVKNDVLNRLISLYDIYEDYVKRNNDTNINILIQDGVISFYLYNDKESVDEFILTFSDKENSLYKYVSAGLFVRLSNDMSMYYEDNVFYNNIQKPYLKMIVNDEDILQVMRGLVFKQCYENIDYKTDIINEIGDSVPFTFIYPFKFMRSLDERITLSRKLLKIGDK